LPVEKNAETFQSTRQKATRQRKPLEKWDEYVSSIPVASKEEKGGADSINLKAPIILVSKFLFPLSS
jgi:hypothetical protein